MTVEEMKAVDVRTVDRESLVDIWDVKVDGKLPKEERIRAFVKQIRNPYCFRVGDVVVKVGFAENGRSLEDCLKELIVSA